MFGISVNLINGLKVTNSRTEAFPPNVVGMSLPINNLRFSWENNVAPSSVSYVQYTYKFELYNSNLNILVYSTEEIVSVKQEFSLNNSNIALNYSTTYSWRVQTSLKDNNSKQQEATFTAWSNLLKFTTMLNENSWETNKAMWIGGNNQLQSKFQIPNNNKNKQQ